tara:strand:+ start:213 stop:467 length:255 start_codon:yes stop_codon:yes gene_type:complete
MSEDTYFYGGNGEEAFTTGMELECYICGEPVMVKIDQAEVDSIMREEKVGQSTARAIAFDRNKKHDDCESDGMIRSSYRLRIDR